MLLEFRVSNFRSIDSEEAISFVPDEEARGSATLKRMVKKHGALPVVVLFGGNGTGKTSIAQAFELFMEATRIREEPVRATPFKLAKTPTHESRISAVLRANKDTYRYAFEVAGGMFRAETLEKLIDGTWVELLSRTSESTVGILPPADEERREQLARDLHPRTTLLAILAAQANGDARVVSSSLRPMFSFHMNLLERAGPATFVSDLPDISREPVRTFLRGADLGVVDAEWGNDTNGTATVRLHHRGAGVFPVPFELKDESDGTRAALALTPFVMATLRDGGMLVIDEVGSALNHWVVRDLVGTFQDPKTNPNHAQLVLTSHDPLLLDEKLLRTDQMLLVDKDPTGASHVTTVSDFTDLPKGPVLRSYLEGRLGGAPRFRALWSSLTPEEGAAKKAALK